MTEPKKHSEQMTSRIAPGGQVSHSGPAAPANILPPKLNIEIRASDGTVLVHMTEDDAGNLVVNGEESRWDEGAKRFLYGMMQWSGQVPIPWKDEVRKAAENDFR